MWSCSQVPAAAWQLLATARWEQLRKANFARRLGEGAAVLKGGGDFSIRGGFGSVRGFGF